MEVIIADFSGFCFGVERAIGIVGITAQKGDKVATYGPIIHNPQVVEVLKEDGVGVVMSIEDIKNDTTIVLRSHGVEKSEQESIREKAKDIVDATCPFVQKAQSAASKLSKKCDAIIVLGEKEHPEVKGIVSYAEKECFVIENEEVAQSLPFKETYGLLAQTTQNNELFLKICDIIKNKCNILHVVNTICNATQKRQKASMELARNVEVMVVVGGKNSANTTRLCHLCREICDRTYHIETPEELSKNIFMGVSKVGITAGASTPLNLVAMVREYILEVSR